MSKYTEMKEFYEVEIKDLRKAVDYWCSRASELGCEKSMLDGKVEIYEKVLSKLMDGKTLEDSVVFFNGQPYKTQSFVLSRNPGEPDTLTVECVAMDILKGE